jgi:hypothetical protein
LAAALFVTLLQLLVKGFNTALGNASVDECLSLDVDHSSTVTVDELVQAVRNAPEGCVGAQRSTTFGAASVLYVLALDANRDYDTRRAAETRRR